MKPAGTRAAHFAWFCREYLLHSIDEFAGLPVELEGWQEEFFNDALLVDTASKFVWQTIALVLPRKNGKTTILAAYALYRLIFDDGQPEILLAAASDKQAGRLFDSVASFVRQSPALTELVVVRSYIGEIERRDGGGRILRMASDPERLHGFNPSLVICDEVAQWIKPRMRKAWAALTTGGGARKAPQTFIISTAGEAHERAESILGRLIDGNQRDGELETRANGALTISRNDEARTLVFNYCALTTSVSDLSAVKDANPASWITTEFLARQAASPELTAAEFLQLHACVWAEGESQWISADHWSRLNRRKERGARLKDGDLVALGFDGSRIYDATALVACRLKDLHIVPLVCWERPWGPAGEGWEVPPDEVNEAIDDAMRRYKVARGYFDDQYWQTDVDGWARKYESPRVLKFPTSSAPRVTAAAERFRIDVLTGVLSHNGDQMLHRHIVNARREKFGGSGYKLVKPGSQGQDRIDLAYAAFIAREAAADAITAGALKPRRRARSRALSK